MSIRDLLLAISVPLIWGAGFLFAKEAIGEFPPILLMAFRFSVTALILVWFVRPPFGHFQSIFWIALVSAAVQYSLTFTGLQYLDASTAIIVVQLEVPFAVLLAALILKDRVQIRHIVGITLAFVGVILIAGEPRLHSQWGPVLLVIGGAFTWALGQVMIKSLGKVGGFRLIAWVAVFAAPQLFVASWLVERDQLVAIRSATPIVWYAIVYLGVVMTAVGYGIWYYLLGKHPIKQVMPFLLLLPVATVAGGVLILDEALTPVLLVGGALAIIGVGIIVIAREPIRSAPS
ncbi:MAG: EamA family transporter [Gammaproteobacteria bacterium]|nr:EamA family transporter [Gammaproteobacteria bacterium]MDH3467555.1 EamA family transporter [Gammaproteobacteria bacterium]